MGARSDRGLTFIEITVVILIMAVMAAVAIPSMRGPHERNKLRASCREMISLMRYARSSSVYHGSEVALEIDLDADSYRLDLSDLRFKAKSSSKGARLPREVEEWRPLAKDVEFVAVFSYDDPDSKDGPSRIVFFPDGSASDSRIVLRNRREESMTLAVDRATAEAKVHAGLPEDWNELTGSGLKKAPRAMAPSHVRTGA